jgi:DNA-directed RNA polymerase specialized sigma24 family protein
MERDDEVLVRLFRTTRDVSLFAELFRRHSKAIYYGCLRVVRNPSVAEDLTQDTFVKAFARIDGYVEQCFAAWLKQIARNLCLNWLTAAANRQSSSGHWSGKRGSGRGNRIRYPATFDRATPLRGIVLLRGPVLRRNCHRHGNELREG